MGTHLNMNLIELTLIEDIQDMWNEDCQIDDLELDHESLKIPQLHSKYIRLYTNESRHLNKMFETHKILVRDKLEYYQGKMCEEDLADRNWEPLDVRILKSDIPRYIEGDQQVVKNLIQISDQKEKVALLKSIVDSVNRRSYYIGDAIRWKQFISGVN